MHVRSKGHHGRDEETLRRASDPSGAPEQSSEAVSSDLALVSLRAPVKLGGRRSACPTAADRLQLVLVLLGKRTSLAVSIEARDHMPSLGTASDSLIPSF